MGARRFSTKRYLHGSLLRNLGLLVPVGRKETKNYSRGNSQTIILPKIILRIKKKKEFEFRAIMEEVCSVRIFSVNG